MTRLIDALLSLSRVEMNAHVPPSDLVDLNDVINHAKDTLDPLVRANFKDRFGATVGYLTGLPQTGKA